MNDFVLQVLLLSLIFAFLVSAFVMRRTRKRIEHKTQRNTASMFKVRDMVHGKIRKFRH